MWFRPTATGSFALLCAEFCGTQHAHMDGQVVVMEPAAYADWLANQGVSQSLAQQGEGLFRQYGCSGCHGANSTVHAPPLTGLYGRLVHLADGSAVRAEKVQATFHDGVLEVKVPKAEEAPTPEVTAAAATATPAEPEVIKKGKKEEEGEEKEEKKK